VVVDEISIVGSRCGRLAPALDLLASNRVSVDDLISDEFSLENGLTAFEHAGKKGVLKVLLRP
jgi:threonine dehydrogenase-like Zn-dependent dehydrogenase